MRACRILAAAGLVLVWNENAALAAPSAAKGKKIFARVGCYECHNYQGQGGVGPRLAPGTLTFEALKTYVRSANGNMPPYVASVLPDEDIADIYAYLASIPKAPPTDSIPSLKSLKLGAK